MHMPCTYGASACVYRAYGQLRAHRLARADGGPLQQPEYLRDEGLQYDARHEHDERVLYRGHIPHCRAVAALDGRLDELPRGADRPQVFGEAPEAQHHVKGDGGGAHGPGEANVPPERVGQHPPPHEAMVGKQVQR